MIYFSLPGIEEFRKLNVWFLELYKTDKSLFYDNIVIDNIYGSISGDIWNGGRNSPPNRVEKTEVIELFDFYKKHGVKLRFTFTNSLLTEKAIMDNYANMILDLISKYNFEITIHSELLRKYINKKYPSISMISSTTKCILDIDILNNELDSEYILTVLDFRKNADFEFLNMIKHPEKVELLLNEDCYESCTNRERHYRDISQNILMYDKMPDTEIYCPGKYRNLYDSFKQKTTIKVEDLFGIYYKMGFNHVKLRGRRSDYYDVLESYVYYMIKPQYKDVVRLKALQEDMKESYY